MKGITAVALSEEGSWQERVAPHRRSCWVQGHTAEVVPSHSPPTGMGRTPRALWEAMASLCRPATQGQTTSVLTAAMIAYALGAGITAAAGTRLALQWLLITGFGLHPFQAPPVLGTSGVAAVRCCLTD